MPRYLRGQQGPGCSPVTLIDRIQGLRDGKITAHWHLAVDPKADAEAASELFAS